MILNEVGVDIILKVFFVIKVGVSVNLVLLMVSVSGEVDR